MGLEEYVRARYVKGVFDPSRTAEIEALGKKGGIGWDKAGKAIFWTTTKSDLSTAIHEIQVVSGYQLEFEEPRAPKKRFGVASGIGGTTEGQRKACARTISDPFGGIRVGFPGF